MATNTHPFGKPEESKKVDSNTPELKEAAKAQEPSRSKAQDTKKSVNKEVWDQAEAAVRNKNGGFAGLSDEGKRAQIQEAYDQMVGNDEQTKKWAGDSNLLGDQK